ncbi:MAG: ABC transporter permease [Wenzhouxiangella sp.]|jgi:peptide/nickel transport system permease protein|nr:ABC transporter permease [Wenzhouxiangella sp.]
MSTLALQTGQRIRDRLRHDALGLIALTVVVAYVGIAVGVWLGLWGAEWSALSGPGWASPSAEHWLGTNRLGQDILARALASTATAFEIGVLVAVATTVLGALAGGLAGYAGPGKVDDTLLWLIGTLEAIPFYLLVAALVFALGGHPLAMHLAMIATFWTSTARLVRAETQRIRELPFIEAARVAGLAPRAIVLRHVLPNAAHILLVQGTLVFMAAIKVEVVLSFLGIGVQDSISWGVMIAEGAQDILAGQYWNFAAASLFLFGLVMAANLLADQLQDALDPRSLDSRWQPHG